MAGISAVEGAELETGGLSESVRSYESSTPTLCWNCHAGLVNLLQRNPPRSHVSPSASPTTVTSPLLPLCHPPLSRLLPRNHPPASPTPELNVRRAARITPVVVGCAGGLGPRETGERPPPLITRFHHGEIQALRRHPQLYTTHHTWTWVVRIIQTIDAASASPGTVNGLSGRESEKCLGSKCLPLHVQVMQS